MSYFTIARGQSQQRVLHIVQMCKIGYFLFILSKSVLSCLITQVITRFNLTNYLNLHYQLFVHSKSVISCLITQVITRFNLTNYLLTFIILFIYKIFMKGGVSFNCKGAGLHGSIGPLFTELSCLPNNLKNLSSNPILYFKHVWE